MVRLSLTLFAVVSTMFALAIFAFDADVDEGESPIVRFVGGIVFVLVALVCTTLAVWWKPKRVEN